MNILSLIGIIAVAALGALLAYGFLSGQIIGLLSKAF